MGTDPADVDPDRRDPGDVCMCGDRREQHRGGVMECLLGDLCHPGRCRLFRLCWTNAEYEANEFEFDRRLREQANRRNAP